jgi:hypothetical protein
MKRILLIASFVGLFMVTGLDLQARHRSNGIQRHGSGGISFGLSGHAPWSNRRNSFNRYDNRRGRYSRSGISLGFFGDLPLLGRHDRYGRYDNFQPRTVDREIRRNEKRIWKLEKKLDRLYRRDGNYGRIRELEFEIERLQRRNDFLRSQIY